MKRLLTLMILLAAAASLPALAGDVPFAGADQPHGKVVLNGSPHAHGLYPVRVRYINDKLTVRENLPVLRLEPGTYKLGLRLTSIQHMENLPGLIGASRGNEKVVHPLTLTVKPGHVYFIAAKVTASGKWHPVVWKSKPTGG